MSNSYDEYYSPDPDGMMFGPKLGSWYVRSKSDPRWDNNGEGFGLVCSGGPGEMHEWIKKM